MEEDHNGGQPQWKTTSMEDNLNLLLSLAQLSPSLYKTKDFNQKDRALNIDIWKNDGL